MIKNAIIKSMHAPLYLTTLMSNVHIDMPHENTHDIYIIVITAGRYVEMLREEMICQ